IATCGLAYTYIYHRGAGQQFAQKRFVFLSALFIGLLAALYLVFCISENSNAQVFELFVTWVQSGFALDLPPKAGLLVPFFKEVSYPLGVLGFVIMTYLVI
ncbi:hypothetical protein ACSFB5_12180, partial [Glaesserella parasuis]|uniref:hypothetical protein n=1 Tax=Glaesserella parasuis TaxID=738 RepID=UPI003F2FE1ED